MSPPSSSRCHHLVFLALLVACALAAEAKFTSFESAAPDSPHSCQQCIVQLTTAPSRLSRVVATRACARIGAVGFECAEVAASELFAIETTLRVHQQSLGRQTDSRLAADGMPQQRASLEMSPRYMYRTVHIFCCRYNYCLRVLSFFPAGPVVHTFCCNCILAYDLIFAGGAGDPISEAIVARPACRPQVSSLEIGFLRKRFAQLLEIKRYSSMSMRTLRPRHYGLRTSGGTLTGSNSRRQRNSLIGRKLRSLHRRQSCLACFIKCRAVIPTMITL